MGDVVGHPRQPRQGAALPPHRNLVPKQPRFSYTKIALGPQKVQRASSLPQKWSSQTDCPGTQGVGKEPFLPWQRFDLGAWRQGASAKPKSVRCLVPPLGKSSLMATRTSVCPSRLENLYILDICPVVSHSLENPWKINNALWRMKENRAPGDKNSSNPGVSKLIHPLLVDVTKKTKQKGERPFDGARSVFLRLCGACLPAQHIRFVV